jgi:hypothetical protein
MAGECCSAGSRLRQSCGSPAVSGRGFEACSHESGRRGRSRACVCHGGRYGTSRILAQDLGKRFPLDTQMQSLWLPAIQAQLALDKKESSCRPECPASCFTHRVGANCVRQQYFLPLSVYVRGEAYLAAGQGTAAAAEFQKILDHSGIVWNCWTGALAHLGVARANALQREPRRERMPMPPASGRSPPTKISSPSGKTPTPTSPS